jgi:hypothetical protein
MTGHAGTVPSSPDPINTRMPEPELMPPLDTTSIFAPEPSTIEDIEGVPHPRYLLPTKLFQVQLPPKITTGHAPATPLDRTKGRPRHWRLAHCEIHSIAGGRWFAKAWVGEKDSELAIVTEAALSLPKLPALSISVPSGGTRTRKAQAQGGRQLNGGIVTFGVCCTRRSSPPSTFTAFCHEEVGPVDDSTAVAASEVEIDIDLVS